ncbi:MAG: PIG-L family deacetylase [Planctomycetes bacterium]|nr:PIG-L family deacetylase [Planctomycetota bacterium]
MNKVLVIAPHMDDELLGVGGTIRRHVLAGDQVAVCIVAYRVYDRAFDTAANAVEQEAAIQAQQLLGYQELTFLNLPDERLDACVQDVLKPLEECYENFKPDQVYLNFYGDNHQDHRAVFAAARVVLRACGPSAPQRILMYETPSSTEQSPPMPGERFIPNVYVDISGVLEDKLKALACYEREGRKYPHPRSPEAIAHLAAIRGVECGLEQAEAFMLLRDIWHA